MTSTNSQHSAAKALQNNATLDRQLQGVPQDTLNMTAKDLEIKELTSITDPFLKMVKERER